MAINRTGGSGGSTHGESTSPVSDDYSLYYLLQSSMEQGSEKNLQPQIGQPVCTGGFLPISPTNQGVHAEAQTQQVTDTKGFSPELLTKQGCQASASTQSLTYGCPAAGDDEERRARKRENDRAYRQRKKEERLDLEDTVAAMGEILDRVEALEAEVRRLKQRSQPHRFNEMTQDKISTSREFEEWPALTNSQAPSSSELRAPVQEKVLPQALRRCMIRFYEKRKQRDRNAAPYNLGKTKKYPKCND